MRVRSHIIRLTGGDDLKRIIRFFKLFTLPVLILSSLLFFYSVVFAIDTTVDDPEAALSFFGDISDAITVGKNEISISDHALDKDRFMSYMLALYNYEPLTFLVARNYSFTRSKSTVTSVRFSPAFSHDDALKAILLYKNALDDCVKGIHGDWPPEAKILYLYDYIANHFVYDHELVVSDAYGLVSQGKGVCQAFTLFATGVLNMLGIENDVIIAPSVNHIWNRVKLGGEWYNVDFTWSNLDVFGNCVHDYLLRSDTHLGIDTDFKLVHMSETMDWSSVLYPEDNSAVDKYVQEKACWYDTDTTFVFVNGYWYFLAANGNKIDFRRSPDLFSYETLFSFSDHYMTDNGAHWSGYFGGITFSGTNIFFTTAKRVMLYDTVTGLFRSLYIYDGKTENCIYGMYDKGGTLDLIIRNYPPTGGTADESHNVESVSFEIPAEYIQPKELRSFAKNIEYSLDEDTGKRLIFGVSEGDLPETLVSALGGKVTKADGSAFGDGETLTTGSVFKMGELEYRVSIPGDVDCNGKVNGDDADYMLKAILNPDYFPVCYLQDFDGSGSVDTDDAIYLFMNEEEPSGFPIAKK